MAKSKIQQLKDQHPAPEPAPAPPPAAAVLRSRAAFATVLNSAGRVEVQCPYCYQPHQHLPADGSVQHCAANNRNRYVVLVPLAELERLQ